MACEILPADLVTTVEVPTRLDTVAYVGAQLSTVVFVEGEICYVPESPVDPPFPPGLCPLVDIAADRLFDAAGDTVFQLCEETELGSVTDINTDNTIDVDGDLVFARIE